jgi:signal transduction histidine kinase/DNA-binding response OmpR family regulator
MMNMPSASVLLDLADAEETESLGKALAVLGLSSSPCIGEADLSETIRRSGADFVLVDGESWPALSASLPHPPRSYLIVVLLDPKDEGGAPKALAAGAFDYILRDGPGWEGRAACYFRALGALRRRLASAFGALERRYEDLVHALPDIVYELDAEGRITFINNSVRLLGYEPAELAGQHFSVLLHDDDALAVDREEVLGWFSGSKTGPALSPKLFNERRGLDRRTENLELRLKRKKGSAAAHASAGEDVIASIISYGEVTAVGEYARSHTEGEAKGGSGAEGAFVGSVGVIRDITLRRKSEDMLRKLYQAVDQLSAGVIVANRDMVVEYVNPAFLRMSDQSPQDLLGRHVFSLFDITEERAAEAASLVDSGFEVREELLLKVAKDPGLAHAAAPSGVAGATGGANSAGAGTWVAFHASPVRSPNGDVTHASIICEDISQQRAMEELLRLAKEEAERADRAKSDFLASMSHELKSPVASILAAARLVEMGSPEPERRARSIIGSAQGLLSLLGDILDFVRFETGGNTLRKFVFPLKGFIARTVEPYRAEAVAKGLAFDVGSLPDESVYSDPDRLGRALAALLDNAVSYTDRGTVRLETAIERRGGNVPYLLLTVSDTGIGIAPEDQGRIFAPFVQLQSPYNKKGGAGIGLSLARNIVRALGGEVRLQSEPGRGSVFTILVPMGEPGGIVEEKARDEAAPAGGRAYRLLVVDDNEVNLEYMAAILGNAGHKVDKASSGAEALKLAEERPPDAALLDIQMPGMSGIELERRMRAYAGSRYDAGLPIFALTAFDPQEVVDSGADFAGIFAKPFDAGLLLRAIDLAVDKGDSAGFGLVSGSSLSFERALKEVPPLFSKLSAGVESGDAESFRTAAQTLAGRLEALGAAGAVAAMRRLALAVIWEDRTVVDSRIRRFAAAWSAAAEARRPGRGDQGR